MIVEHSSSKKQKPQNDLYCIGIIKKKSLQLWQNII